jgi:hypothetical protein
MVFLAHRKVSYYNHEWPYRRPVSVSGTRFATAGSIPAKLEYDVRQGYISRPFFHFRDLTYFKRDMRGI